MRIAVDLNCLQTEHSRNRGIGFFTQELLQATLAMDCRNEYLLLWNAHLPEPALVRELPDSGRWQSVRLRSPVGRNILSPGQYDRDDEFRHRSYVESVLLERGVDLIHVSSPFEWEAYTPVNYRAVPVVATVFDLIPLVFRERYLDQMPPVMRERYLSTCEHLKSVDRIVTISQSAKDDIRQILGVAPEKVDVVYASAKDCFGPTGDKEGIAKVRRQLGLEDGIILCTGGIDYRKNVERVIESFSLLPKTLRERFRLVLVCRIQRHEAEQLREVATSFGVADRLALTGYVSDETLALLYSAADVVLFPSLYEGFGLPVLEAQRCGAAVITSETSSLPEVAGDAALLVDPYSAQEIAKATEAVLTDDLLRLELRRRAPLQAAKFSGENLARGTMAAYDKVHATATRAAAKRRGLGRRRVAFFSPLNPQKSGISDYSEDLLPFLAEHWDVDLYVDGHALDNPAISSRFPAFDYRQFEAVKLLRRYDAVIYQMGNSSFHEYMYGILLNHPGVVVLHDVVLHGLIRYMTIERGRNDRFVEEMVFCYGEDGRRESQAILQHGLTLEQRYGISLNKRVVSAALGVITHSDWARDEIRKYGLDVPVVTVRMGVEASEDVDLHPIKRRSLMREVGIPPSCPFVVASFGHIASTKRPQVVVKAFARLLRSVPEAFLLFVGELHLHEIRQLIAELGIEANVRITGFIDSTTSGRHYLDYLRLADAFVSLRYPTAGETSGAVLRIMGLGKPQIVSNLNQFREIPDEVCWKLDLDELEEDTLVAYLRELAQNVRLREVMGVNARRHVRTHHTLRQAAAGYVDFLESVLAPRRTD